MLLAQGFVTLRRNVLSSRSEFCNLIIDASPVWVWCSGGNAGAETGSGNYRGPVSLHYLTRFRTDYHGGLHQLLTQGADFTNAFYQQVPTVTAIGHSIFMSGAMPAVSGIVGNAWYDRAERQVVTSVCDWNEKTVGGRSG